jgi:hypothetical protein
MIALLFIHYLHKYIAEYGGYKGENKLMKITRNDMWLSFRVIFEKNSMMEKDD